MLFVSQKIDQNLTKTQYFKSKELFCPILKCNVHRHVNVLFV